MTTDPRGVFVSLSHVCPTAGRLLLEPFDAPCDLVHEGPVVTPGLEWTGLDARDALPPQVSAEVLWDWDALSAWERGVLDALERSSPEIALSAISVAASTIERWRPNNGETLTEAVATAFDTARLGPHPHHIDVGALDALARESAPHALAAHAAPADRAEVDRDLIAPAWAALAPLVSRYLAARSIANPVAYHSARAGILAASMETAYAVLRTEAARQTASADRQLDASLLVAASADADRLLVHRMDAARLAAGLLGALPS